MKGDTFRVEVSECKECHLLHPPVPQGERCPVAVGKESGNILKEAKISELIKEVRKFTNNRDDYEMIINRVISFIRKYDLMFTKNN